MTLTVNEFVLGVIVVSLLATFASNSVVPLIPCAMAIGIVVYANKELEKKRRSR